MLHRYSPADFSEIYEIINDAATAYKGFIPKDQWHDPYMSKEELRKQIDDGVEYWCYKKGDIILGTMGIQNNSDGTIIRYAFVRTASSNKRPFSKLLGHLVELTSKPVLIGTWADAAWAIDFYRTHGFRLLPEDEKNTLLRK